jgi:hypothetical protein
MTYVSATLSCLLLNTRPALEAAALAAVAAQDHWTHQHQLITQYILIIILLSFCVVQALPQDRQGLLLAQQQPVLEALTAALVRRTQLNPAAAAAATADARDLPEEMRMVRCD